MIIAIRTGATRGRRNIRVGDGNFTAYCGCSQRVMMMRMMMMTRASIVVVVIAASCVVFHGCRCHSRGGGSHGQSIHTPQRLGSKKPKRELLWLDDFIFARNDCFGYYYCYYYCCCSQSQCQQGCSAEKKIRNANERTNETESFCVVPMLACFDLFLLIHFIHVIKVEAQRKGGIKKKRRSVVICCGIRAPYI